MKEKLKIGLIGCGTWGKNILADLVLLGADTTVFDINPAIKNDIISLGANSFETEILNIDRFDGLVVSTPAVTHLEILDTISEFNKPIYLEKPLCTSKVDLERVKQELCGKKIFLMHVWRYHNGIIELGRIAKNKNLGNPVQLITKRTNWTSPRQDVDSVWTLVPHDLTIVLEIFGYIPEPKSAICEFYKNKPKGMLGIMGEEPSFIFEVSNRYIDKRREVRLHCENGVAVLKDEKVNYIDIYTGDSNSVSEKIIPEKIEFQNSPPLKKELETFLEYLNGGDAPKSSLQEGILIVENILLLRKLAGLN